MKRLKLQDVTVHYEPGQHWAFLNPLRLAQVLVADSQDGIQDEPWIVPIASGTVQHLSYTSLVKTDFFGTLPSVGSVWSREDDLFFVGAQSTEYPNSVWVYSDWKLDPTDNSPWIDMREIQSGPEPLRPVLPEDATALEQLLEDD